VGTDISPAMLAEARRRCPGVEFVEHDFRVPRPEWDSAFDLVTSTWYAYTLVDTIADACRVFDNLAAWTRPEGTCFVPLADPRLIARSDLPYEIDDNFEGETTLTGILWSYSEDDGSKVHSHMVVPMIELVVERFGVWFEEVDVHYPEHPGRPELTARGRRSL
ncbi:MAG: class I SAM-dependent methyltransferase, partial [Gaiellaceae bacterium]